MYLSGEIACGITKRRHAQPVIDTKKFTNLPRNREPPVWVVGSVKDKGIMPGIQKLEGPRERPVLQGAVDGRANRLYSDLCRSRNRPARLPVNFPSAYGTTPFTITHFTPDVNWCGSS